MQREQQSDLLLQVTGLRKWYPLSTGWFGKPSQTV